MTKITTIEELPKTSIAGAIERFHSMDDSDGPWPAGIVGWFARRPLLTLLVRGIVAAIMLATGLEKATRRIDGIQRPGHRPGPRPSPGSTPTGQITCLRKPDILTC